MSLPFTPEQFFDVFRRYNEAIWPAQVVLYALAAGMLVAIGRGGRASRAVALSLALLWIWTGAVYHLGFFREVNPAAGPFAVLCFAGGVALLWQGVARDRLQFAWQRGARGWLAVLVISYALVVYPAIGLIAGHGPWASPTFGTPCPTTIFTFGVLMLAPHAPAATLVVPAIWAAIATQAAFSLDVPQDFGLPVAAVLALGLAWADSRSATR